MLDRFERQAVALETEAYFPEILEAHGDVLKKGVQDTRFYASTSKLPDLTPEQKLGRLQTRIRVIRGDTIDVARSLMKEGLNPCVLNMASDHNPGGGWKNGALAQEEELFRRSTYALSLVDPYKIDKKRSWRYPISVTGGIYSPNVFVFRENIGEKYRVMKYKDCFFLNFVAVPAMRRPKIVNGRMGTREVEITKEKMRTILRIAYIHGHTSLLLSAFGCGAYQNPPSHIAALFQEVFNEAEFLSRFDTIDFAIIDNGTDNFDVFQRQFQGV